MDNNSNTLEWNNHYSKVLIPNIVWNILCLMVGLVGNSTVLVVYKFTMKCHRDDRYFIPILAVCDLMACSVGTAYHLVDYFYFVMYPSRALCVALVLGSFFMSSLSAHILLVIGIQRYLKICRPIGKQMTLFWRKIAILIIICVVFSYTFPTVFATGFKIIHGTYKSENARGYTCSVSANRNSGFNNTIYGTVLVLISVVNIIGAIGVYIPIGRVIYRKSPNKKYPVTNKESDRSVSHGPSTETSRIETIRFENKEKPPKPDFLSKDIGKAKYSLRTQKGKVNFNYLFMMLVVFYFISYLPTTIMLVVSSSDDLFWFKLSDAELNFYIGLARLYIVNHIVNPFIYGYFDFQFRKSLKALLKC